MVPLCCVFDQIAIRNFHAGPDRTESNDCWLQVDGGDWVKVYSSTVDEYGSPPMTRPMTQPLTPARTRALRVHTCRVNAPKGIHWGWGIFRASTSN